MPSAVRSVTDVRDSRAPAVRAPGAPRIVAIVRSLAVLSLAAPLLACGDNTHYRPDAGEGAGPDGGCAVAWGEPELALERVADGLDRPVHLASPSGDSRLFVVELARGTARIIRDGAPVDPPFLSVNDDIGSGFEQGLLSLVFHPDYALNGRLFISWARGKDNALVVEEWLVALDDPDRADAGSRRTLLEIGHSENFHYGGHLVFGPDGMLYVSVGDGGPQFDSDGHAQDLGSLRGKLLRIDVDRREGDLPYAIPGDNPFVGVDGARAEVFAYGLRNPWRFVVEPSGTILIGDVGFDSAEELDVIPGGTAGQNFGWPILEGTECQQASTGLPCDVPDLVPPVYTYNHAGDACAIMLGPVYRGCAMPGHHGKLLLGDFCDGWSRSLVYSGGEVAFVADHPGLTVENVGGWGVDAQGEVYLLDYGAGTIDKIVPAVP